MGSQLEQRGRVYSFEPNSASFERLQQNIRLNNRYDISAHHVALTNEIGSRMLSRFQGDPGQSYLIDEIEEAAGTFRGDDTYEQVATTTVNEFARHESIRNVDLMKVDAEMSDDKVLAGSSQMLSEGAISYVIHEYHEGEAYSERSLGILESYGYETFYIVRNGTFLVRDLSNYPHGDFKGPLNMLSISPAARSFSGGEGLDVRG